MKDLYEEFAVFDQDNPGIWQLFVRFANEAIAAGHYRLGVSLIIERIRWEVYVATKSDDDFKINNNHRAYYARKWIEAYPEYANFFEIRRVRCGPEEEQEARWRDDLFDI